MNFAYYLCTEVSFQSYDRFLIMFFFSLSQLLRSLSKFNPFNFKLIINRYDQNTKLCQSHLLSNFHLLIKEETPLRAHNSTYKLLNNFALR